MKPVLSHVARSLGRATAATAAAAGVLVLCAGAAAAGTPSDLFDEPETGLTFMETAGLFVLLPLAICALIAVLVLGPSMGRGPRHRPGSALDTGPVWVDPSGAATALRDPVHGRSTGAGTADQPQQGGVSGHW